jgi:hypothetical protein
VCELGVSEFLSWFEAGDSGEVIVNKGVNLCLTLNIQTERVCRGFLSFNIVSDFFLFVTFDVWILILGYYFAHLRDARRRWPAIDQGGNLWLFNFSQLLGGQPHVRVVT